MSEVESFMSMTERTVCIKETIFQFSFKTAYVSHLFNVHLYYCAVLIFIYFNNNSTALFMVFNYHGVIYVGFKQIIVCSGFRTISL